MSKQPNLLPMLSDQPADEDRLNFDPYAKTLADILGDPNTHTPLTIGVFGTWGHGKTSLMRMVRKRLETTAGTDFPVHAVWFNAWLYSREQALWRALIAHVLRGTRQFLLDEKRQAQLDQLESRLYQATEAENGLLTLPPGLIPEMQSVSLPARTGLELWRRQAQRQNADVSHLQEIIADVEASYALTHRARIVALDDFRREFEDLSKDCVTPCGRLVVFVDDLDRCLPDKAVEVLEAVKLFLDVPGFAFVLGIDREVIEEGIRVRYQDYETKLDGARYLEKIIQIPFNLPPIDLKSVQSYIHDETAGNLPDARCETVFSVGLEANPRRIKRTLNVFLLLWRLSQNRADLRDAIKPVRLAKIVIIQQYHPRLFALLAEGPHHLIDLERRFRESIRSQEDERMARDGRPVAGEGERGSEGEREEISAGPLTEFLNRSLLRELLTCIAEDEPDANFIDLTPAGVREYIYLTRSAAQEEAATEAAARLPFEPQMVTIPAGAFLMGTPEAEVEELAKLGGVQPEVVRREVPQHEVTLSAYAIARYPVTNAEFRRFIEDSGYTVRDYWTETGWQQKEKEGWTQPRFWDDGQWNDPSQPVVGVSWYEAVAYCNWLSAKTKRAYRLPTEAEWEKAARSTDGRRYPWGNTWDAARCNNKESGLGKTTPVGQYPDGDSPYGVSEMVGQVWEWCSSKYGGAGAKPKFGYPYKPDKEREDLESDDTRILRGGSWYSGNPAGVCRCSFRNWDLPGGWNGIWGFRFVRTSPQNP